MTDELLIYIDKLSKSDDKEMVNMGEALFYMNNPTNDDIMKLNRMRGHEPILDDFQDIRISDMIKNADLEANIL
jgi:hypothetical protein